MATPSDVVSRKKEEQKLQKSPEELEELKKTLENWTDIAVVVMLIGKPEALLTRIIAEHYYNLQHDNQGDKKKEIVKSLKKFKKQPKDKEKLGSLEKAITGDGFEEVCQRIDEYKWFENHDTRSLLLNHKQLEDNKKLFIGLIYEYISVVCDKAYTAIINEVKNLKYLGSEKESEYLKEIGTDLEQIREIRNRIVHSSHRFKRSGEQIEEQTEKETLGERDTFLKKYEGFVRFCVEKKKWLCLSTQEVYIFDTSMQCMQCMFS